MTFETKQSFGSAENEVDRLEVMCGFIRRVGSHLEKRIARFQLAIRANASVDVDFCTFL